MNPTNQPAPISGDVASQPQQLSGDSVDPTDALESSTAEPPAADYERLDPAARRAMRWSAVATSLLLALSASIPGSVLLTRLVEHLPWAGAAGWIAGGLLLLLSLRLALAYANARFERFSFRLDQHSLEIRRGVFWRSEIHVLRSRVQHTDLSRGPIERRLGLSSVIIHTAGTESSTLRLSGLGEQRARQVRDALLEDHDEQF